MNNKISTRFLVLLTVGLAAFLLVLTIVHYILTPRFVQQEIVCGQEAKREVPTVVVKAGSGDEYRLYADRRGAAIYLSCVEVRAK